VGPGNTETKCPVNKFEITIQKGIFLTNRNTACQTAAANRRLEAILA
jgi:hypothetical protein